MVWQGKSKEELREDNDFHFEIKNVKFVILESLLKVCISTVDVFFTFKTHPFP